MNTNLRLPPKSLDPEHIAELGSVFMASKFLCVGVELGIFEKLGGGPLSFDELAASTGLPEHSLRVLVNGLTALGHLQLSAGRYENSPEAQAFLTGLTAMDMRPGLRLFNQFIYPMWMQMEDVVRTGEPARHHQPSEHFARIFSEGVEAWTRPMAVALPKSFDFGACLRLLDIGGGTGSYLVAILEQNPQTRGTLFELPATVLQAQKRIAAEAVRERIDIVEGDALCDPLPEGHDVVLMAAVLHLFDPERIVRLLRRAREAVCRGATLLLVDQWMDATCTKPAMGALLAGTYLILSGKGATYSVEEAQQWVAATGWRFVDHRPLSGPTSLIIAEAAE